MLGKPKGHSSMDNPQTQTILHTRRRTQIPNIKTIINTNPTKHGNAPMCLFDYHMIAISQKM